MSWSVSSSGTPDLVSEKLAEDFAYPLAQPPAGISDDGERETVRLVKGLIDQVLGTFGEDQNVMVVASGHMANRYQFVNLKIEPIS